MNYVILTNTNRNRRTLITPNSPEDRLCEAIKESDLLSVRHILQIGVDMSCRLGGWTPLCIACYVGSLDIVQCLLGKKDLKNTGIGQTAGSVPCKVDEYSENGDTALIVAARKGHCDICNRLLQSGAMVDRTNQVSRQSALVVAIEHGHVSVVELLLQYGADVQLTDNVGITALYVAVKCNDPWIVRRLIDCGADVNLGSQDHSPLFLAARRGLTEIAEILVEAGCAKDIANKYGVTPLFEASCRGSRDVLDYLVSEGCDVNSQDMYNVSPVHIAAMSGHVHICKILVEAGAILKLRTDQGKTALDLAVEMGRARVVEYFLELGLSVSPPGRSPQRMSSSLVQMLESDCRETTEVILRGCARLDLPNYPDIKAFFWKNPRLLRMLLLSGIDLPPRWTDYSTTLMQSDYEDASDEEFLTNHHSRPLSLKALSRVCMRRALGNTVLHKVKLLPLPTLLKHYTILKNL